MTAADGRHLPSAASSVSVRLTGDPDACARLLMLLVKLPCLTLARGPRGPYACDTESGVRWYLTVRAADNLPALPGAAHNRQAIRRPAAPSRRHHR
jgi:hypothetical protein